MQRRIGLLLGVALLTTIAVIAIVVGTRPDDSFGKGKSVPNVAGTTLDGQPLNLASLRGHPVVINFWASTCVPCRDEFPLFRTKMTEHADAGLVIVGVLTNDSAENGRAFAAQFGATWPSVADPDATIKNAYRVVGLPQSFFVDRSGILRSIQIGEVRDADFERQYAAIATGS
jgi:cytochrome c biogenesis protein CcmG/thiol:disulfide interchange protein DsbE